MVTIVLCVEFERLPAQVLGNSTLNGNAEGVVSTGKGIVGAAMGADCEIDA